MAAVKDFINGNCRMIVYDEEICPAHEAEEILDKISGIVTEEEYKQYYDEKRKQ